MSDACDGDDSRRDREADLETAKRKPESGSESSRLPAAGPHAKPELTNENATPGSGTLPEAGDTDATNSTTG